MYRDNPFDGGCLAKFEGDKPPRRDLTILGVLMCQNPQNVAAGTRNSYSLLLADAGAHTTFPSNTYGAC